MQDDQEALQVDADPGSATDSDADSDVLGPDGWDDVLSAWMTNAGVLTAMQQASEASAVAEDRRSHTLSF